MITTLSITLAIPTAVALAVFVAALYLDRKLSK